MTACCRILGRHGEGARLVDADRGRQGRDVGREPWNRRLCHRAHHGDGMDEADIDSGHGNGAARRHPFLRDGVEPSEGRGARRGRLGHPREA